ncbi:ParB/RepB/Spo0J family partition protein [Rhodobacter capsulatus]|uniref:ParB/RepB/Spo0J family partition protein n=1 Tax=Rhodobacter capsulatus TaxID=1061 RepID=UPI004029B36E
MAELLDLPLSDLYLHPLNARPAPSDDEIAALAESLKTAGLLQNLLGFRDPARKRDGTGIVGGGRRLRALQLIHGADAIDDIPVLVTDDEATAREWALTENTARAALNPADEVLAYRRMGAAGADPERIAKAFATTARHVRGRLKLATLPDAALDLLRTGSLSLDQAAALTLGTEAQVLDLLPRIAQNDWQMRSALAIKRALQPGAVPATDRRAIFVGLDLYCAEGGQVAESLFLDEAQLLDSQLLDTLFERCCAEAADRLRAGTGWAQVRVCTETYVPYPATEDMDDIHPTPVDLPEADRDELEELTARAEVEELTDTELARLEELEARAAGDYTDADRETGIAFYVVDKAGKLTLGCVYRPREAKTQADDTTGAVVTSVEKLPQSVLDDLRRIQSLTLQTALMTRHDLVLALQHIALTSGLAPYKHPMGVTAVQTLIKPEKGEVRVSEQLTGGDREQDHLSNPSEVLTATLARSKKALELEVTRALIRSVSGWSCHLSAEVAALAGANPRTVWTPDAEFFKRLKPGQLDAIWSKLVPADLDRAGDFRSMKKADKARDLGQLFGDDDFREALGLSRDQAAAIDAWLPAELRASWPHLTAEAAQ